MESFLDVWLLNPRSQFALPKSFSVSSVPLCFKFFCPRSDFGFFASDYLIIILETRTGPIGRDTQTHPTACGFAVPDPARPSADRLHPVRRRNRWRSP